MLGAEEQLKGNACESIALLLCFCHRFSHSCEGADARGSGAEGKAGSCLSLGEGNCKLLIKIITALNSAHFFYLGTFISFLNDVVLTLL